MRLRLLASLSLLLLPGCVIVRGQLDRPLDDTKIGQIQRGTTTKHDILALFGPPQLIDSREIVAIGDLLGVPGDNRQVEQLASARYFRYEFGRLNSAWLLTGVFNYLDVDVKRDVLVVFFDGKNVVEDFAFAKDTELLPALGPLTR